MTRSKRKIGSHWLPGGLNRAEWLATVTCNQYREQFMTSASKSPRTPSDKVRRHRARLRARGLRPLQVWVPDTRAPGFAEEARRQSQAVAASEHAEADQAFIDAISEFEVE